MAYTLKDVFYLDTVATAAASTDGSGSAQLDLSAYIDPIARGRSKGTGLAVYRVHWHIQDAGSGKPIDDAEAGTMQYGLIAGAGVGDTSTGGSFSASDTTYSMTNNLLISSGQFFGPRSMVANASTTPDMITDGVFPSDEVPYVIVRDNACLVYTVGAQLTNESDISCRLEVAQVSLDQATLNQLLRTQTV
jgi:hypothetical protein